MKKRFRIIQTYWFLIAVGVLLLNDFILKDLFHNWLTGKLSDFAGIFFLPLFLAVIFPKRIKELIIASALFFTYWKSPLSDGLINWINTFNGFNFVRVIDYTDLLALSILPLSYYIYSNIDKWATVKITPAIPLSIAAFAMMATSQEEERTVLDTSYTFNRSQSDIFTSIAIQSNSFETNHLTIRFPSTILADTIEFSYSILGGRLDNGGYGNGKLKKIDNFNCEIYFLDLFQTADKNCGLLRPRCEEEYDDKILILEELETRFIYQL